jgi:hypothetical protein
MLNTMTAQLPQNRPNVMNAAMTGPVPAADFKRVEGTGCESGPADGAGLG